MHGKSRCSTQYQSNKDHGSRRFHRLMQRNAAARTVTRNDLIEHLHASTINELRVAFRGIDVECRAVEDSVAGGCGLT
jgi:hypothetical protein